MPTRRRSLHAARRECCLQIAIRWKTSPTCKRMLHTLSFGSATRRPAACSWADSPPSILPLEVSRELLSGGAYQFVDAYVTECNGKSARAPAARGCEASHLQATTRVSVPRVARGGGQRRPLRSAASRRRRSSHTPRPLQLACSRALNFASPSSALRWRQCSRSFCRQVSLHVACASSATSSRSARAQRKRSPNARSCSRFYSSECRCCTSG